ncbi:MAG: hypothetical protein Q7S23_05185 [bacterium]|nr:hypothetical protein [bacterium]
MGAGYFFRQRDGQSLAELTVAVFIILMALTSIATLVTMSLRGQRSSEETAVANNLAREGIEVARWLRDNALLRGAYEAGCSSCTPPSYTTLPYPLPEPTPPTADQDTTVEMNTVAGTWTLNFNSANGSFSNVGTQLCLQNNMYFQLQAGCPAGTGTRYRRRLDLSLICIRPDTNAECVTTTGASCPGSCAAQYTQFAGHVVRARVNYPGRSCSGSTNGCVTLEDYLYVWK